MKLYLTIAPDGAASAYTGNPVTGLVVALALGNATTLYLTLRDLAELAPGVLNALHGLLGKDIIA